MSGEDKKSGPEEAETQDDDTDRVASDLEDGVESLGRAFGGAMTRLFGERVTGQKVDPEKPVLGAETDKALGQVSQSLGRLLHAAGKSMQDNPTRPGKVLDDAAKHGKEAVEAREGETELTQGLRSLASGLYKTTEVVLDKVAPRQPKDSPASAEE